MLIRWINESLMRIEAESAAERILLKSFMLQGAEQCTMEVGILTAESVPVENDPDAAPREVNLRAGLCGRKRL